METPGSTLTVSGIEDSMKDKYGTQIKHGHLVTWEYPFNVGKQYSEALVLDVGGSGSPRFLLMLCGSGAASIHEMVDLPEYIQESMVVLVDTEIDVCVAYKVEPSLYLVSCKSFGCVKRHHKYCSHCGRKLSFVDEWAYMWTGKKQ